MNIGKTLTGLDIVKSIAKLVPVVGTSLEALIDLIIQGCKAAEGVHTNKEASVDLSKRAALLGAAIVYELQKLNKKALERRLGDVHELLLLVQEIKFSHERRASRKWWSRTWRKEDDKEEIKSLSDKLDEAVERFGISALITMKGSLDAIITTLRDVEAGQTKIREAQVVMGTTQAVIKDKIISVEEKALLDTLNPVDGARHNVQNAPSGCLKGTREQMIRLIVDWATNESEENVFWLSGLAGVGKTALARTVCDELAKTNILGAAFFISRSSAERTKPQNVVRSIIHQLAHYQSDVCGHICDVLRSNRMVATQSISFQVPALLFEPLRLAARPLSRPIVLVIDALDECDKDDDGRFGGELLPLLLSAFCGSSLPVKLLVTSRFERTIQVMFSKIRLTEFRLHQIDQSVVRSDIRLYLEHSFGEIAAQRMKKHEAPWPAKEVIDSLTDFSGGLFIFAVTVVKYVRHSRYLPGTRLNGLLSQRLGQRDHSSSSFHDLDKLYRHVLQSALGDDRQDYDDIGQRLRKLLGILIVLFEPPSIALLAALLNCDEELLRLDLESLSAVILVPEDGSLRTIHFFHASFSDFLSDPSRCTETRFLLDSLEEFHKLVAVRCMELQLQHLTRKSDEIDPLHNSHDMIFSYIRLHNYNHSRMLNLASLNKVTRIQRECLEACSTKHSNRLHLMNMLSRSLLLEFDKGGGAECLQEAVDVGQQALHSYPQEYPDIDISLSNLGNALLAQFEQTGKADLIAAAISLHRESLDRRPRGHPNRDSSLNNLANALQTQFEQTGKTDVLDEATYLYREALELCPQGHPSRDIPLNNLANALLAQFGQTDEVDLLAEAILLYRESLELCPRGHPSRDISVTNLASALVAQFEHMNEEHSLEEAIHLYRELLELHPRGHPGRDVSVDNLANALLAKFERIGEVDLLFDAIQFYRESLELRSRGHPNRDISLDNLANAFKVYFEQSKEVSALEQAIHFAREALETWNPGHPNRGYGLLQLASLLEMYATEDRGTEVLVEAESLKKEANILGS